MAQQAIDVLRQESRRMKRWHEMHIRGYSHQRQPHLHFAGVGYRPRQRVMCCRSVHHVGGACTPDRWQRKDACTASQLLLTPRCQAVLRELPPNCLPLHKPTCTSRSLSHQGRLSRGCGTISRWRRRQHCSCKCARARQKPVLLSAQMPPVRWQALGSLGLHHKCLMRSFEGRARQPET